MSRDIQEKFFYTIGLLAYKNGDMSDSSIAKQAGISPAYYSQMKNLHKSASLSAMISIARVFGMEFHLKITENNEA